MLRTVTLKIGFRSVDKIYSVDCSHIFVHVIFYIAKPFPSHLQMNS